MIAFLTFSLSLGTISLATAQQPAAQQASVDVKHVAPFVGETTSLIFKVAPHRMELPKVAEELKAKPEIKAAIAEALQGLNVALTQLRRLAGEQPIFATVGIPISRQRVPVYLFQQKTSDVNAAKLVEFVNRWPFLTAQVRGEYIVVVPKGVSEALPSAAPRGTLETIEAALAPVAHYPAYAIVVPPEHVWRTVRELSPQLPRQLGGGPSRVLTDGVQWVAIGFDPKNLRIEAVIQSTSDQAARDFAAHLPVMFRSAYAAAPIHEQLLEDVAKLLFDGLKPQIDGSRVKIRIDGLEKTSTTVSLLASVAREFQERSRRQANQIRFQQILIGMHNYHDTYGSMPPADKQRGDDGRPRLSWRVHILPFVEQKPLYDQFHMDEPWDSPHNKTLLEKMPDIYASKAPTSAQLKPGSTAFLAPVGKQTIFGGAKATRIQQITDGASNTVALVEVTRERAVPWTAPDDFAFDPQDPLAGVPIGADGTWLGAFADGSARQLSSKMDPQSVLHLFQMNDGNIVELD